MNIVDNLKIVRFDNEPNEHGIMCKWGLQVKGSEDLLFTSMFYIDGLTDLEVDKMVMSSFCKSMRTDGAFYEEKILEQLEKRFLKK